MNWFKNTTTQDVDSFINNTFYSGLSSTDGINLRMEVNNILNDPIKGNGHYILYRRYDRSKTSEFYNPETKEGVNGPKNIYTDIIYKTRRVPYRLKGGSDSSLKPGQLIDDKFIYYFEYNVCPKRGDDVFELNLGTEEQNTIPSITTKLLERYIINTVHPYRQYRGRVEYWLATCTFDEVQY